MKLWKILSLLVATASAALAQQHAEVQLPKVPPFAHWKVDFIYPKPSAAEAAVLQVTSVDYVLAGRTGEVTKRFSDGTERVSYWVDHYQLERIPPAPEIHLTEIPVAGREHGFFARYPGLEWLRRADFVNSTEAFGETCLYFKRTQTLAQQLEVEPATLPANPDITMELWVSATTGQPVAFTTRSVTQRYTFLPAPTQPIELPADFRQFLEQNFKPGPRPGEAASRAR